MHLNPPDTRVTVERPRRVDVHIFLFPFALDMRADGAACQSEGRGTEAKEMGVEGGESGNEIEVGSEGEVR